MQPREGSSTHRTIAFSSCCTSVLRVGNSLIRMPFLGIEYMELGHVCQEAKKSRGSPEYFIGRSSTSLRQPPSLKLWCSRRLPSSLKLRRDKTARQAGQPPSAEAEGLRIQGVKGARIQVKKRLFLPLNLDCLNKIELKPSPKGEGFFLIPRMGHKNWILFFIIKKCDIELKKTFFSNIYQEVN